MIDWNASAAWIALIVSVIGTIASPLITTALTNHHQKEMFDKNTQFTLHQQYHQNKFKVINNFLSSVGAQVVSPSFQGSSKSGENFFQVYAYAPSDIHSKLDQLYKCLCDGSSSDARILFSMVATRLADELKEESQASL